MFILHICTIYLPGVATFKDRTLHVVFLAQICFLPLLSRFCLLSLFICLGLSMSVLYQYQSHPELPATWLASFDSSIAPFNGHRHAMNLSVADALVRMLLLQYLAHSATRIEN